MSEYNEERSVIVKLQPDHNSFIAILSAFQTSVKAIEPHGSFQAYVNMLQALRHQMNLAQEQINASVPIQHLNILVEKITRLQSSLTEFQKSLQATEAFHVIENAVNTLNEFNYAWNERSYAALRALNNFMQSELSLEEWKKFQGKFDENLDELSTVLTDEATRLNAESSDENVVITLGLAADVNIEEKSIAVLALLFGWLIFSPYSWEQFETKLLPALELQCYLIIGTMVLNSLGVIKK